MNLTYAGEFQEIIHLEETFRAPAQKIFEVWTEARHLKNWFLAEAGFEVRLAEVTLEIPGRYRIEVGPADPSVEDFIVWIEGNYLEIERGVRLSYTWNVEVLQGRVTEVSVRFSNTESGSKIELTHGEFRDPQQMELHADGWVGCISALNTYTGEVFQ